MPAPVFSARRGVHHFRCRPFLWAKMADAPQGTTQRIVDITRHGYRYLTRQWVTTGQIDRGQRRQHASPPGESEARPVYRAI